MNHLIRVQVSLLGFAAVLSCGCTELVEPAPEPNDGISSHRDVVDARSDSRDAPGDSAESHNSDSAKSHNSDDTVETVKPKRFCPAVDPPAAASASSRAAPSCGHSRLECMQIATKAPASSKMTPRVSERGHER